MVAKVDRYRPGGRRNTWPGVTDSWHVDAAVRGNPADRGFAEAEAASPALQCLVEKTLVIEKTQATADRIAAARPGYLILPVLSVSAGVDFSTRAGADYLFGNILSGDNNWSMVSRLRTI